MKRALQQIALAIVFGLGIPGIIFGVMVPAERKMPGLPQTQETTVWAAPADTEKEEAPGEPPLDH